MKALIQKTWKHLACYLHGMKTIGNREIHHINGRIGVFLACKLLVILLTKKEHDIEHISHVMRDNNMELIRDIRKSWDKRAGCTKQHKIECKSCPLLASNVIQDKFFKTF